MAKKPYNIEAFDKVHANLDKALKTLPILVADYIVVEFKNNFDRKAFFDEVWKPSIQPPTMVKSNDLKNSIRVLKASGKEIIITSDLEYSRIQNEGGRIRKTPKMIKFFWAKYKQTGDIMWKRLAISTKPYIEIPKRQYMGEHPKLKEGIEKTIIEHIQKNLI